MNLTQVRKAFNEDGFVVLRDYLAPDLRDEIVDRTRRFISDVAPTIDSKRVFFEDRNRPETMLRVEHLNLDDPWFAKLADAGPVRELAEHMLSAPVRSTGVSVFGKSPRIGKLTPPHQDAFYWRITPKDALTVWIAIDRADEENGCVRYVPGSHLKEMQPHELSGVFGFSQHITDYDPGRVGEAVPACVDPGELIVHHGMTIHYADPNESDRLRRALGIVYYAEHVRDDESAPKFDPKKQWAKEGKL